MEEVKELPSERNHLTSDPLPSSSHRGVVEESSEADDGDNAFMGSHNVGIKNDPAKQRPDKNFIKNVQTTDMDEDTEPPMTIPNRQNSTEDDEFNLESMRKPKET